MPPETIPSKNISIKVIRSIAITVIGALGASYAYWYFYVQNPPTQPQEDISLLSPPPTLEEMVQALPVAPTDTLPTLNKMMQSLPPTPSN